MKSLVLSWSALLSLALFFGPTPARAQAGSLDPTFGRGGVVLNNFGSSGGVYAAALQSDGKILVLISNGNFEVVRFLSNGSLDTSFGSGGSAQVIFANNNTPQSLSLQSNGSIVVTGIATNDETNFELVAARFDANGNLDSTFGVGGQAAEPLAGLVAESVSVIQPDGKILIAGSTIINPRQSPLLAMTRFNSDGSVDSSFGNNGSVETTAATFSSSLGLDAAGNIFVVGGSAIREFNARGQALAQVTPAPIVVSANGGKVAATTFLADGRFLDAEVVFEGRRDVDTKVARFTATGAVDPTFQNATFDFVGEGGFGAIDVTSALVVQPNGKVVLGASHISGGFSNELFALARLNPNGTLDPTFGAGGKVTTNVGGMESVNTVLLQPDGKIIALGTANSSANVTLARYLGQ